MLQVDRVSKFKNPIKQIVIGICIADTAVAEMPHHVIKNRKACSLDDDCIWIKVLIAKWIKIIVLDRRSRLGQFSEVITRTIVEYIVP